MKWVVYDPSPELASEGVGPDFYGPYDTEQAALEKANILHPDDASGDAKVYPLIPPDDV